MENPNRQRSIRWRIGGICNNKGEQIAPAEQIRLRRLGIYVFLLGFAQFVAGLIPFTQMFSSHIGSWWAGLMVAATGLLAMFCSTRRVILFVHLCRFIRVIVDVSAIYLQCLG